MPDNELHSIAFPRLDDDCLAALGECTHTVRKTYADGEASSAPATATANSS